MQPWMQIYDPLGNLWLSSLVAALPIIFFFVALAVLRMKGKNMMVSVIDVVVCRAYFISRRVSR